MSNRNEIVEGRPIRCYCTKPTNEWPHSDYSVLYMDKPALDGYVNAFVGSMYCEATGQGVQDAALEPSSKLGISDQDLYSEWQKFKGEIV